ncbi:LemA family protein [Sphingorhabdus arenilitoris]|uniref:LemA family protein n=1 Tax=Sphingorhabdus arenilitoris TaxID=1490041 RepID=A0ABV8REQ3_9SPHN
MRPNFATCLFVPIAAVSLAGCGINSVPTAEENAKAKWADVESAYQRRADLIPNLVKVAERFVKQEQDVLIGVTEARAKASSIQVSANDLTDAAKLDQFAGAQQNLGTSLGRLLVTVEKYPELKSDKIFADLNVQLEGTENRINTARVKYNEAVQQYNTTIRTFPDIIGAKVIHGAKPMVPFKSQAGSDKAPEVNFGS